MTFFKRSILCMFLACSSLLQGEIYETDDIQSIRQHITPDSLVIFDIDNTIMEPVQTIGSDQWFHYRIDCYLDEGFEQDAALEKALSEWMAVQNITQVQEVQLGCGDLISELQRDGYCVMGLTTRGLGLSTRTLEQLKTLDIDLNTTAPTHEEVFFMNHHGVLFRGGILFTAGSHKGMALMKLLDRINYHPQNIVFINDKATHLKQVEETVEKMYLRFTGLRYGYLDSKVDGMRKDIANIQFEQFGKILSDAEAEQLLSGS